MHFLGRLIGSLPKVSQARHDRCPTRRVRARIELEALEGRALLSIQGVSLSPYGSLAIVAPKASGNVAIVSIDPSTHNVEVSLNGQSEEFSAKVFTVSYKSGANGGDTFTNNTSLTELAYGSGGNNDFTGGTGSNTIYFYGNDNTFTGQGGISAVYEGYGTGDVIDGSGIVYAYKY